MPRKRNESPSNARRDVTRAIRRATEIAQERQAAWADGGHPNVVCRTTTDLTRLYERLRSLRRKLYAQGEPEGSEFMRSIDRAMAEIIVARSSRKREGEALPVVTHY